MISFKDLNRNQGRAVNWSGGPLLVLAGPGSGKTAVLTLRVARLLRENEHVAALALTFTNKAAAEMRERVDQLLEEYSDRARLCTFHKFAAELLEQHGSHIGLRPGIDFLTQDEDRIAFLEDVIKDLPGRHEGLPEDRYNLLRLIDRLFSESYDGQGASASLPNTPRWLPSLFVRYCEALINANRPDFRSLLYFANRLLREKPAIAQLVGLAWTHVCVDEFQDTNRAQYDLLRQIAPHRNHNLFVVADDDQIIYQWNGAGVQRLEDLRCDYDLRTIQLPENYRCPPEIVSRANRLIVNNTRVEGKKKMVSHHKGIPSETATIRCKVFDCPTMEAQFVGRDIQTRGLVAADCAVLGRTNKILHRAAEALVSSGQEAFVSQKKNDFDSPALGVMVEALRMANLRHDRVVLGRLCRQWNLLSGVMIELHAVEAAATLVGGDFLRAWVEIASSHGNNPLVLLIRNSLVDGLEFPQIVDRFLAEGWQPSSGNGHMEPIGEEVDTWRALHQEIIGEYGSGVPLNTYLQHLDLSSKAPLPKPNAVQCITVHRAKGLQFRHVYLIGMSQGVFPFFRALNKGPCSKELEEERRSCFVAITRAQETLTLTRSREYFGYAQEPSQFLGEMGLLAR